VVGVDCVIDRSNRGTSCRVANPVNDVECVSVCVSSFGFVCVEYFRDENGSGNDCAFGEL